MPIPSLNELKLGCVILACLQWAVVFRFIRRLRAGVGKMPDRKNPAPRVAVLIPCAGENPHLVPGARALLAQEYPGEVEFLFVTPSAADPAHAALESLVAEAGPRARLLASEKTPEKSSGKIVDVLYAIEKASPETEIFAFVDADLRVPAGWLDSLAGALDDPAVGVATAAMLYVPRSARLGALLRTVWMASGIPYFDLMGNVTGQSFAMRKIDFEALDIAGLWSVSLLEDLALTRRIRGWDKRVEFVWRAVPWSVDDSGWSETLAVFNKWLACYRVYDLRVWGLGALVTAFKTYVFLRAVIPPPTPELLALLFGMDALGLLLVFLALQSYLPERFEETAGGLRPLPLFAAAAAPLLQAVYLINYLYSLTAREILWGPYAYRLRGPQDVTVRRR